MLISIDWTDAVMHILIVIMSFLVLAVSVSAYKRKPARRYLYLSLAFFFLFMSQFATLLEVIFLSNVLVLIPSIDLHLSHVFDFMTLLFFILALTRDRSRLVARVERPSGFEGSGMNIQSSTGDGQKNWTTT